MFRASKDIASSKFREVRGVNFDGGKNTLLLTVNPDDLNVEEVSEVALQSGLNRKSEFHLTIIGFKSGKEITKALKNLPSDRQEEAKQELKKVASQIQWEFLPQEECYRVSKEYEKKNPAGELLPTEIRESIIRVVEIKGLEDFYRKINELLGISLPLPFPHATLYTKSNYPENNLVGIGIDSKEVFDELSPRAL